MTAALPDDLVAALQRVAGVERLLVASDFDGVLAPLVLDPMQARAQEGTLEDLRALAAVPGTDAALVSGRDLETLVTLTGSDDGLTRLGSHGGESSRGTAPELDPAAQARLAALVGHLQAQVAQRSPRARLELKPSAAVLHTRGLDEADVAVVDEIADDAARADGVRLMRGKSVVELSVAEADKGTALLALARELRSDALVYLGDDVTDEHVFEAAGPDDVTIKVGEGDTAARHRVERCEDVPAVLALLRSLRSGG